MTALADVYPKDRITLREVGLRDGLQLVKTWPDTDDKLLWLSREAAAGVAHFEVGSFLPVKTMPQFADVRVLVDKARDLGVHAAALALNERGADDAIASLVPELVCVVSATDAHSEANMRRSRKAAVTLVGSTADKAAAAPHKPLVHVGLSVAFGCPLQGDVPAGDVIALAEDCLEAGADMVSLADTVGFAGPAQVAALSEALEKRVAGRPFGVHLHDTRGMGIANAAAALSAGASVLDGSLGGLGGCPHAPGASGNVVFEDLVFLCERMGFATGIDLQALAHAREVAVGAMPGEPFVGALAKVGPPKIAWRAGATAAQAMP